MDPQKARNSLRVFVSISIIGAVIGIAAWFDAKAEDFGAVVASQGVSGQAARGLFDAVRRGVNRGVPRLARSRAVSAMNVMPALNATVGTWTFVGPDSITNGEGLSVTGTCGPPARITVTGRITAIAFGAEGIYVGSASGGVWKSTDGGAHWKPLTDRQMSLAVGALAVVPGPPDTVYVGTGEGNNGCDNEYGQGILKSQNGGASWTQLAAATFDRLSFTKIALEMDQPGILYAGTSFGFTGGAAGECLSASSGTAGLYKSTDAGVTWARRSGAGGLPGGVAGATADGSGSVYDVAIDPAKSFSGPFAGTVVALNGADCAGSATLSAVDPNNPANPNPFKLTAEPNTAGGYDLDGTLTLTQDPLAGLNPPGICDDFSGTYKCSGTVADVNGAPAKNLICVGGNFNQGAGTTLTLTGSFTNGNTDNGTFTGTWSLEAGAGPDTVKMAPLALKSAPAVFAAVGGSSGGLFRSTDAGMTWAQAGAIAAGRRFAMDFAPDGDRFYIAATTLTGPSTFDALYVSTDHGGTFAIARGQPSIGGAGCLTEDQGDQDLALAIDPADSNSLYIGMIGVYASTDGGASFIYTGAGTHGGQHAIVVTHGGVYLGNDGGFFQSNDAGKNWTSLNTGLGVVQFQGIGLDANAAAITGGTQDNGINQTKGPLSWSHAVDGDGGFALIDQADPAIYFGEHTGLSVLRSHGSGALGSYSNISPGAAGTDPLQLYPPLIADPSNPERILLGTIRLWESCHSSDVGIVCDGASSPAPPIWTVLSADLTGGCTSGLCDISDIAVAPTKPDVTYLVTSSDGTTGPMAWVTQNGTAAAPTFSNITPPVVAGRPLTSVTVSPLNYQEVVITASGFTGGGGHVFLSTDLGGSWSDISGRLPDIPALSAAFDPAAPLAGLFVGTDIGVFHTADLGNRWRTANLGRLPVVPVYQLRQAKGIVAAATHGRGVWTFTGSFPSPTPTPTPSITSTPAPTPTRSPTPTPIPGHPFINKIPPVMLVGGSFQIQGFNFTAGSMVNFFVATSRGPLNTGPLVPTARTATSLTVKVPATNPVGDGFVSLQVVNTDQAFVVSNLVFGLLQGSAAAGIPTITGIDGIGLAPTSADPNYATNNVETVIAQGDIVNLSGTGFDVAHGVAVDLFCACPRGKVGPFFLTPGNPGLTAKSISFPVPGIGLPNSPPTGPGSLVVSNSGADRTFSRKSNAVSVPIGEQITVAAVTQSGATLTIDGTGFSALTVINFFNQQGAKVVNLGGIKGGAPVIPIALVNSGRLIFTVPANAIAGPAYVQALNPPFVPFTSSGNDPGGAFNLL